MSTKKIAEKQNPSVISKFPASPLAKNNIQPDTKLKKNNDSSPKVISNYFTDKKQKTSLTRIVVKYDVGFSNSIFIRGTGGKLSWDKGILMDNTKPDEWVFETLEPIEEFKVLINDRQFELGANRTVKKGASLEYTPNFYDF
jgi:hypothetical protein